MSAGLRHGRRRGVDGLGALAIVWFRLSAAASELTAERAPLNSKWARAFMWAQFGLVPPPDGEPADPRHVEAARKRLAIELVGAWNVILRDEARPLFSPTLEAAFLAGCPWLRLFCPGCQQQYEIDLRKIVRPKDFPIMGLRAAMVCESMCRGVGPEPQLLGVHPLPFDHRKLSWRGD